MDDKVSAYFKRVNARLAAERGEAPSPVARPPDRKRKRPNPVIVKLAGYRRFFTSLETLEPRLSPGAVALWSWLWTCEKKGHSRCTARRLAKRFSVAPSTAKRWLAELRNAGFIRTVRRGKPGKSASLVRIRCTSIRKYE